MIKLNFNRRRRIFLLVYKRPSNQKVNLFNIKISEILKGCKISQNLNLHSIMLKALALAKPYKITVYPKDNLQKMLKNKLKNRMNSVIYKIKKARQKVILLSLEKNKNNSI